MANEKTPQIDEQTSGPSDDFIGPRLPLPTPDAVTIAIPLRWVRVSHKTPDHIAARYPYAAYGSNLALEQMAGRCPMADPVGAGTLRSARLVFAYHLGIVEDDAATVPIGVYRLTAADIATLDRYEGLGRSYERYLVTVELNGEAVRCFTYIKRNNEPEAPSERYYGICLQGYTDWQMDTRRLRHARDFARKNQKVRRWSTTTYSDKRFDFDDWYKATFPDRINGNGTASMRDDFIPEGNGTASSYQGPHKSLVTGRMLSGKRHNKTASAKRYEDMRPDEIRDALNMGDPAGPSNGPYPPGTTFTGKNGQTWIKDKNNVWRRAPKGE